METPILEVRSISKRFGATQALSGVSLSFRPGTVHAVVGENGAGKSTLMNLVGGVHQADAGEIFLDGRRVTFLGPNDALRMGIGFVHQEIALCQHMSVAENVFMHALRTTRKSRWSASQDFTRGRGSSSTDFDTHSPIDPRQMVARSPSRSSRSSRSSRRSR